MRAIHGSTVRYPADAAATLAEAATATGGRHHDPAKFGEFRRRYTAELAKPSPGSAPSRRTGR